MSTKSRVYSVNDPDSRQAIVYALQRIIDRIEGGDKIERAIIEIERYGEADTVMVDRYEIDIKLLGLDLRDFGKPDNV